MLRMTESLVRIICGITSEGLVRVELVIEVIEELECDCADFLLCCVELCSRASVAQSPREVAIFELGR